MRAYLIDEITPSDMEKINGFLESHAIKSHLDRVFWVQIPESILSETQIKHAACQPHVFSVEMGPDWVKLEFFIRSLKTMGCTCPGYCAMRQMDYVIRFSHRMIEQLWHQDLRSFLFLNKDFSDLLFYGHGRVLIP